MTALSVVALAFCLLTKQFPYRSPSQTLSSCSLWHNCLDANTVCGFPAGSSCSAVAPVATVGLVPIGAEDSCFRLVLVTCSSCLQASNDFLQAAEV